MRLFAGLRDLSFAALPAELFAALALTAIALPEQMATARLLDLPPTAGLLAYASGTAAFALLGRHRTLSVGADSTIAPIMAAGLGALALSGVGVGAAGAALLPALAVIVGLAVLLSWPLRLGWIADLLSAPVSAGFMAAIALHISAEALGPVLGVEVGRGSFGARVGGLLHALPNTDPAALGFGLGAAALSTLSFRFGHKVPGPLIALIFAGLLGSLDASPLAHLPRLPAAGTAGLQHLIALPTLPTTWGAAATLFQLALLVALLVLVQTAAVLRALPDAPRAAAAASAARSSASQLASAPTEDDPGRDLAAVGLGSVLSGLLGGFAVNASPPRTAVAQMSGATSQLSALLAAALALGGALLAAPLLVRVPEAALSGVLLAVGLHVFPVAEMRRIRGQSRAEWGLAVLTSVLLLATPILPGMGMAVTLSLVHAIYAIARPATAVLARVPGTTVWWNPRAAAPGERVAGVLVFAPGAPLSFLNARYIAAELEAALAREVAPRLVVIEGSGVLGVDVTGAGVFREQIVRLRARGITVALARLESPNAARAMARTGLAEVIGKEHVFLSVEEAVRAFAPGATQHPSA